VADTKAVAKNESDNLIYALYPTTGMRFLKWKYGLEPVPEEVKGKSLDQIKLEDEVYLTVKKKNLFVKVKEYLDSLEKSAPEKGPGLRTFNVFVDDQYFEVEVECTSGAPTITGIAPMAAPAAVAAPKPATAAPRPAAPAKSAAAPAAEALGAGEVPLRSPMPGMIISYSVKVGDKVNTGDPVCILEAMKMQNSLTAPASGTIKAINFESGASVAKDAILLVISK
jgi:biotin carboxyl carrier protein